MLTESKNLDGRADGADEFNFYSRLVDSFVEYLKDCEDLKVSLESDTDTEFARANFLQMPAAMQKSKLENFLNYYDHCRKMTVEGHSLRKKGVGLKSFLFLYGLSVPSQAEVFDVLDTNADVYVEIYDRNFLQMYRSPSWLETTSYGLKRLETQDWRTLFFRSDEILKKQMEIVTALYSGQVTQPVHRPIRIHTVKELTAKAPYCCEIESLVYTPVYDRNGEFVGGLHLMKLHDLRRLDFQVYSSPSP